jgi:hypothetical protein
MNSTHFKTASSHPFQSIEFDPSSRLVLVSTSFGEQRGGELAVLDLPSLHPRDACRYEYSSDEQHRERVSAVTVESCSRLLGAQGLREYLKSFENSPPTTAGFACKDNNAEYCPQPNMFTSDQMFGLGIRSEGRDNLFGSWVQTRATAIIFSTKTRAQVAEIDLTRRRADLKLATTNGQDYLLLVRDGSELLVYELPS